MKKDWSTVQFMAIGALAALYVVLSAPGAVLAAVTGVAMLAALGNILIIGVMYPLIVLLFKRLGAATLWALLVGVLFIPFPLAGPPGFFPKVLYMGFWGALADFTYFVFKKRSEKFIAIAVGAIQIAPGAPVAIFLWRLLGAPELAEQLGATSGFIFTLVGVVFGAVLGYLAYIVYKRLRTTAVVRRIQQ